MKSTENYEKIIQKLDEKYREEMEKIRKEMKENLEKIKELKKELCEEIGEVLKKDLEEKLCKLDELEDMNSVLLVKERRSNDEIQEAHKELIKGLKKLSSGESCKIGVKRIGELDEKPFMDACKKRITGEEAIEQFVMLYSEWQQNVNNPALHPFKRVGSGN